MYSQIEAGKYEHVPHANMQNIHVHISKLDYCPPHFHSDFEFTYIIKGCARLSAENETVTLHEDGIALMNPYQFHAVERAGEDCVLLVVQATSDFCKSVYPELKYYQANSCDVRANTDDKGYRGIASALLDLGYNYLDKAEGHSLRCMSDVYRLFWHVLRFVPHEILDETEFRAREKRQSRVRHIVRYMREHYTEKITLSDVAKREGLSLPYASHLFKVHMGVGFQEYLNMLRLDRAAFLLENTELDLLNISVSAGFSDPKYMNRHFLERYGMSARDYRARRDDIDANTAEPGKPQGIIQKQLSDPAALDLLRRRFSFGCEHNVDDVSPVSHKGASANLSSE